MAKKTREKTKSEPKNLGGRPSIYTDELAEEICETIACTPRGLPTIIRENPHFPSHDTIYKWIRKHKAFSDKYLEAKQLQVFAHMEETYDIADDTSRDFIETNSGLKPNTELVARSSLRVNLRKWQASRLMPRLFGEKFQSETVDSSTLELTKTIEHLKGQIELLKAYEREY